jgi:hypothetical protein
MYVAPEARGLGVGRALAVAAVEAAADLGFEVLRLETHADLMPVAVKLYRELGFRDAEPYHSVVGVEGLLTMELRLPGRTQPGSPESRRSDRGRRSRCRTGAMRPSENSASRHSEYAEVGTGRSDYVGITGSAASNPGRSYRGREPHCAARFAPP